MTITTKIKAGDLPQTIPLPEGQSLTLSGSAGASGVAYLLDQVLGGTNSLKSWAIGNGTLPAIGGYAGTQQILITCTAGSINADVGDAVLGAVQLSKQISPNDLVILGDSITAAHWTPQGLTSASRSAGVTTIVSNGHQMMSGQKVLILGIDDKSFNGFYPLTRIDANTFSYPQFGLPDVASAGVSASRMFNPYWQSDQGYMSWARGAAKNRINLLFNAGVNGDTTAGMLARLSNDVFAYGPAWVSVMAGINDLMSAVPVATVFGNLQSIYQQCRARGCKVVAMTILPLQIGHPAYSLAVQQSIMAVNALIRAECKANSNMILVDSFAAVVDPTSASAQPMTGYLLPDNIHPSPRGAKAIGEAFAQAVTPFMPLVNNLISSGADNRAIGATNPNLWPSLPSTATGGQIIGSMTGAAPAQFSLQTTAGTPTTAVASGNARTLASNGDTAGYSARCVFRAAAAGDQIRITGTSTGWSTAPASGGAAASVGNAYSLEFALDVTGMATGNIKEVYAFITASIDGNLYRAKVLNSSGTSYPLTDIVGYVCQTPPFFCQGSSITWLSVDLYVTAAGAASAPITIDVGRVSVREIPAGSVLTY